MTFQLSSNNQTALHRLAFTNHSALNLTLSPHLTYSGDAKLSFCSPGSQDKDAFSETLQQLQEEKCDN
jgi:hypothetical protein